MKVNTTEEEYNEHINCIVTAPNNYLSSCVLGCDVILLLNRCERRSVANRFKYWYSKCLARE